MWAILERPFVVMVVHPGATGAAVSAGGPAAPPRLRPASRNSGEGRLLAILVANMFLVATCISMMAPMLLDLSAEFHVPVGTAGQLSAAAALPWALLAPVMGMLSDRLGRRPVLAVGSAFLGLMTLLSATAWSFPSLFIFRFLSGVAGAASGPNVMASVMDYFPADRRGRAVGLVLAALSLATVAGVPMLAMVAAYLGWRPAFAGLGFLLILLGPTTWIVFPKVKHRPTGMGFLSGMASALGEKPTPPLLLANLLERLSFTAVMTYLAAFLMQSYSLRLSEVAPILSTTAAGTVLGSVVGGRLADRGKQALIYSGFQLLNCALAVPLFGTTPGVVPSVLLVSLFGIGSATARPAWMWLISRVPEAKRGATMGFTTTTNQLGIMLGASVGGMLVGPESYEGVGFLAGGTAFAAALLCRVAVARGPSRYRGKD